MSAVLLAEIRQWGGEEALPQLLELAESTRSPAYLCDLTNWISYGEAVALWRAGMRLTHNPRFPELIGRRAAERLSSSSVATLLRSLGSPEKLYEQIALSGAKFSTVVRLDALEVRPGHADISAAPVAGFPRSPEHCAWTLGLLSGAPILFGVPEASVLHDQCAALGAEACLYRVDWGRHVERVGGAPQLERELDALKGQLEGMQERLANVFATASDLIAADDIGDVLARITDRAALQVRAPRYLLAVRMEPEGEVHCHHRGFDPDDVPAAVKRILAGDATYPKSWLVVPVRSNRQEYGSLMAAFDSDEAFFPQERELLELYARYAASALDGAAALTQANRRYGESSALLRLAHALSTASTSGELAQRLANAVPLVVDCDRVGVYLWDPERAELVRRAFTSRDPDDPLYGQDWHQAPSPGGPLERFLETPSPDPLFVDIESGNPVLREELKRMGELAAILAPISTSESFLGLLSVSVTHGPERLKPTPDLLGRLRGVSAQATTALENGLLVDQITYQAEHDQLTGLVNRARFGTVLREAVELAGRTARLVAVFYLDLDGFKVVNDEFGHDIGDQLLALVASRLVSCTRAGDTVARLGGDEFAVVAEGLTAFSEAEPLAARLAGAFSDPFIVGPHRIIVLASIGRAVFPVDGDATEDLLRRADGSMFEMKRARARARAAGVAASGTPQLPR